MYYVVLTNSLLVRVRKRSVGHQLEVLGEPQDKCDVKFLRKLTADYMRQNPDTFKPFIEVRVCCFCCSFFFALTVIPGPPLFSLTIRLRNPFPLPCNICYRPKTVEAELPKQCASHVYCGQRNSTKFAPAPP